MSDSGSGSASGSGGGDTTRCTEECDYYNPYAGAKCNNQCQHDKGHPGQADPSDGHGCGFHARGKNHQDEPMQHSGSGSGGGSGSGSGN